MVSWTRDSVNSWLKTNRKYGELADAAFSGVLHQHNWQCLFGHKFVRTFNSIRRGKKFCPNCVRRHYDEEIIRFVFQELFDEEFPKARPTWLRDDQTGIRLALDGFSQKLLLAFEYEGDQILDRDAFSKSTQKDFVEEERLGRVKDSLCVANGVTLIRFGREQFPGQFEQHVLDELALAKLELQPKTPVKLSRYNGANNYEWLNEAKRYAQSHGGALISREVTSLNQKLQFSCERHPDQPIYKSITIMRSQRGSAWCIPCGVIRGHEKQKLNYTEVELQSLAAKFEPPIRKLQWAGNNSKGEYLWQCLSASGHFPFKKSYHGIRVALRNDNHVCPSCNGTRRIRIWDMHQHAERMGGHCLMFEELSKGGKTIVPFSCHNDDHPQFELTAAQVRKNRDAWCSRCQSNENIKRYTAEDVRAMCNENGFALMSSYSNNHTPMEAECSVCGYRIAKNLRWMQRHNRKNDWCDVCRQTKAN